MTVSPRRRTALLRPRRRRPRHRQRRPTNRAAIVRRRARTPFTAADDLGRFVAEQELLRRLARESALPLLELDVSDDDVPAAAGRVADWLEATGGLYGPSEGL